jgi:hypothetical protein
MGVERYEGNTAKVQDGYGPPYTRELYKNTKHTGPNLKLDVEYHVDR